MKRFPRLLAAAALLVAVPRAEAYTLHDPVLRWPGASATLDFDLVLPGNPNDFNHAFEQALGRWNAATTFTFGGRRQATDPCDPGAPNGAGFRSDDCGLAFGSSTLAVAHYLFDQHRNLVRGSIVFKTDADWGVYDGPWSGPGHEGVMDFARLAVHELGHVLGLGHETGVPAVMQPVFGAGNAITAPTADDISGVLALYPDGAGSTPEAPPAPVAAPAPASGAAVVAALLPSSRSVPVGGIATVFATMINAGGEAARGCWIAPLTELAAGFFFQESDPLTNRASGMRNQAVDIPPGGARTFVIGVTPREPFDAIEVELMFDCEDTAPAPSLPGVNTLLLSASSDPVPDVVALAATLSGDGVVTIPGDDGTGVFAVAAVNVGAAGTITAVPATGANALPLESLTICQTDPASGACLAAPASTVTTFVASAATPSFAVFAKANGVVTDDPAGNRTFVRFRDTGAALRGATSVAARTSGGSRRAANDDPVDALLLAGRQGSIGDGDGDGGTAWWRWVAPADGLVTFDTFGSDLDTTLAAYAGDDPAALQLLVENDDVAPESLLQSQVGFAAVAGRSYYLAVGAADGTGGAIRLNWVL